MANKRGRDAVNGQFTTQANVKKNPKQTINETIKKPTKKKK